jgi:hypothetical protein
MVPFAVPALGLALLLPQSESAHGVRVRIANPAPVARTLVVPMSVPFPLGSLPAAAAVAGREPVIACTVRGAGKERTAPGLPLMRWPDGSIAVLQVHARCELTANREAEVEVLPQRGGDGVALPIAKEPHRPLLTTPLLLWVEVLDPWDRVLRADLVPDASAGVDGIVWDTGAVRVVRYRASFRATDGNGEAGRGSLFDLRAYLWTADGERAGELTLVLDNQEPLAGPLGPMRFRGCKLCTGTANLRFLPRFAVENLLTVPAPREQGGFDQWLLRPGDAHYLGDGTAKAFSIALFLDDGKLGEAGRLEAQWASVRPCAFPDLDAVRASRAFGAHGGPAPVLGADTGFAGNQLAALRAMGRFGPYSGFGDPENGGTEGAPRQGDSLLHNVLRWRAPQLLDAVYGMVLQQSLRPTAGRTERKPKDTERWREGLGPLALAVPHGFTAPDYEHASALLLFDYYWLTGDPFARDELARLGRGLSAVLAAAPFRTSRGEGSCLEALVLCGRATGDRTLVDGALQHAKTVLLPLLAKSPPHIALAQPPHPAILEGKSAFDAPWQMALLVRGLVALQRATGDQELVPVIVRIADAMATSCWVEGQGLKTFVSATDLSRYTIAAVSADRAGYDRMTIGAFELAREMASDPAVAARLFARSRYLLDRDLPPDARLLDRARTHANPWLQIALDRQSGTK